VPSYQTSTTLALDPIAALGAVGAAAGELGWMMEEAEPFVVLLRVTHGDRVLSGRMVVRITRAPEGSSIDVDAKNSGAGPFRSRELQRWVRSFIDTLQAPVARGSLASSATEGAETEAPRLTWPVRRAENDLIVSVIPSRVAGEHSFRPVDRLPSNGQEDDASAASAKMASTLAQAIDGEGTVAAQKFAARSSSGRFLTFALAISLADMAFPRRGEAPQENISDCQLPCGSGMRIFGTAEPGSGETAPPIPLFNLSYIVQTDFGVLALAFSTPHVDAAREFAVLFESIATSCTIQPATPDRPS
jgi:hypothetical protein